MPGGLGYMKKTDGIFGGILVITLLFCVGTVTALDDKATGTQGTGDISVDITPYNGPIDADSPLYELKLAMEDLDETFTFNDTQRVEKRLDHAQIRIAELLRELDLNRTTSAERTLELYRLKLNLTEGSLTPFGSNATGLLHAQEMITRHQTVLANLLLLYPNNSGLSRAYKNSLLVERKFEEKTEMRFSRFIEKNNKTILKAVKLEIGKQDRARDDNSTTYKTSEPDSNKIREKIKDQKDVMPVNGTITQQAGKRNDSPSFLKNPQKK